MTRFYLRSLFLLLLSLGLLSPYGNAQTAAKYKLRGLVQAFCKKDYGVKEVAIFAEIKLPQGKRAVIYWPMVPNGDSFEDNVMGAVFEKVGKTWVRIGKSLDLSHGKREAFLNMLGEGKQKWVRPAGKQLYGLGTFVQSQLEEIAEAYSIGHQSLVLTLMEELSGAFGPEMAFYNDFIPEQFLIVSRADSFEFDLSLQSKGETEAMAHVHLKASKEGQKDFFAEGVAHLKKGEKGWRIEEINQQ